MPKGAERSRHCFCPFDVKNSCLTLDKSNDVRRTNAFQVHGHITKFIRQEFSAKHEYRLYLDLEDIDHTRTKAKTPQTNGTLCSSELCSEQEPALVSSNQRICLPHLRQRTQRPHLGDRFALKLMLEILIGGLSCERTSPC